jgi:SAM-dependent methyltransferase
MDHFYDLIYADKNYHRETEEIIDLIFRLNPQSKTLLDAACGTGRHLEFFKDKFVCEGFDVNPKMAAVAHERTGVPIHVADMVNVRLGKTYDVITCLFGSIAYVMTYENLLRTIANFSLHLNTNGLLVIEPFVYRGALRSGFYKREVGEMKIESLVSETDGICTLEKTYRLPNETRHKILHLGLFYEEEYNQAFRENGFSAQKIQFQSGNFQSLHVGVLSH